MTVFKDHDQQSEVYREMERLQSKYGLKGELLSIEELARVLGKTEKDLWNLKARSAMPPIPLQRLGGRDHFRLAHVAMFSLGILMDQSGTQEPAVRKDQSEQPASAKPSDAPAARTRKLKELDVMGQQIEARTMEILRKKNPKLWGGDQAA